MTLFEYINRNYERLKKDIRIGLIDPSLLKHYEIICRYDQYKKQGFETTKAVRFTGYDFNISARWVYKILEKMTTQLPEKI